MEKITKNEANKLTTSKLAQKLEMKTNELNRKFAELGYLEKKGKDFHLTAKGKEAGGQAKSTGARAYVLWPVSMEAKVRG